MRFLAMLERRADERTKKRMRLHRFRLELGMELAAQIPGMIRQLADFDVDAVRSLAGEFQAVILQNCLVIAIEFVAMPVAFADFRLSVSRARKTVFSE